MKDMYIYTGKKWNKNRGVIVGTFIAGFGQCGAIISMDGQIQAIQVHNKSMYILIKTLYLYDVTPSIEGQICIEVREHVLSEIGELIGHFVKEIHRNCICML